MEDTYWLKQNSEPLFPDLVWSRPENKQFAGKLLIIGGNSGGMEAPATAYRIANEQGIGVSKVLLPEALQKLIGKSVPDIYFAPSNKSGGFSRSALVEWIDFGQWADGVLLAGDTARNSETAIVTESFLDKYNDKVIITGDTLDQFISNPMPLFRREKTLVIITFAQLQKTWPLLNTGLQPLLYTNSIVKNIDLLHQLTLKLPVNIMTKQQDKLIVASNGRVSTTNNVSETWRVEYSARAAVWWIQHPTKPFEAITVSIVS